MHKISIPDWARDQNIANFGNTAIDPLKTALIVIDMQNFFMTDGQGMANPNAVDLVPGVNRLTAAMRAVGGMVVLVRHSFAYENSLVPSPHSRGATSPAFEKLHEMLRPGSFSFDLHADLVVSSDDVVVTKYRASVLHPHADSGLLEVLRQRGIDTLIITGLVTNGCCECTARDAQQYDFSVIFVVDGTATGTDAEHNAALLNISRYFAELACVDELCLRINSSKDL